MLQLFLKIVYGTIINTLFFMKITCYDPSIYLYNRLTLSKLNLVSFYENKVIIITGASSGIGKALALLLYSYGANLILTARNKEMLELVANQCFQAYPNQCGKILIIPFDIENYSNIDEFVTTLKEKIAKNKLDHVDMILNNAGVSSRGTAIETSLDTLHSVMVRLFYVFVY